MKTRKTMRKILSVSLIIIMIFGTSVTGFAATTFSDVSGHWATASINYGVANGFIKGYTDGTFKPDNPVTRAEFSKMLNVAFGISNTQAVNFSDVPASEWYSAEVRKAVAAGYISGYEDNTFRPNNKITRQEAAFMIANVIPTSGTTPSLAGLVDNANIADWARAAVTKVYAKGYMKGDNKNMYNPVKSLTRAEAATILSNIVSKETIVSDDTTISTNGKVLSDTIYANDLTISKSLGTGSVELRDSMVLGTMNVQGGGTASVGIYDTNVHNMSIAKTTGDVRVFLSGDSTVKDTIVENGATLEHKSLRGLGFQNVYFNGTSLTTQEVNLIGSFKQLYVNIASTIKSTGGTIANAIITRDAIGDTVKFGGTFTSVTFEGKTLFELLTGKITTLNVNSGASSSSVKMGNGTSIATAIVDATKTAFTGTGVIARLEANANDITYETKPTRIVVAGNVTRDPVQSADVSAPVPTFVPAGSATGVLANTTITITFDEPIFLANGNAVITSGIPNIVELRETSSTGTIKPYTATINTAKTIITLTPNAVLTTNTNYYIVILSGTIEDAIGNQNSKITSTFKTGTTDVAAPIPTFTPANGATGVAVDANITIVFNESLYNSSGTLLTTSNFNSSSVVLKEGSSSGADVAFAASYSGSSGKTITINPTASLAAGTYYVAVKANIFRDSLDNVVPLTTITFSTIASTASKAALTSAISAANANKDSAAVSVNGLDVLIANKWVTGAVKATYASAIATAQTVADNASATQIQVDTAVTALASATTTFNNAKASGLMVTKAALTSAISAANANKDSVAASVDGSDVLVANKWVTSAVKATYNAAIGAAQTVADNASATQTQIDSAVTALAAATTTFNNAKVNGLMVTKATLTSAIAAANANKASVVISADGSGVSTTVMWVTPAVEANYTAAIGAAQTVADNASATQTQVDTAVTVLASATTTFNSAKASGLMVTKAELTSAISAANSNKVSVVISTDGTGVSTTVIWVATAVEANYTAAIGAAQTVADNASATQTEVDAAIVTLANATTAFNTAKAYGTLG